MAIPRRTPLRIAAEQCLSDLNAGNGDGLTLLARFVRDVTPRVQQMREMREAVNAYRKRVATAEDKTEAAALNIEALMADIEDGSADDTEILNRLLTIRDELGYR